MQTDATLLAKNTQQCRELLALVASICMGLKSPDRTLRDPTNGLTSLFMDSVVKGRPKFNPRVDQAGDSTRRGLLVGNQRSYQLL